MCYILTIGTREAHASLDALLKAEATLTPRGFESPFRTAPSDNPSVKSLFPSDDRVLDVLAGQCSCHLMPSKRKGAPHEALCRWLRKLALTDGGVRVFVHWYSGSFDTERVRNDGTIRLPVDRLTDADALVADRLIHIVSPRGRR